MTNKWIEITPTIGAFVYCLQEQYITLRISKPANRKFIVSSPGSDIVVFGERFTLEQDRPRGGQCRGERYRLKGILTWQFFGVDDEPDRQDEGYTTNVLGEITDFMVIPPISPPSEDNEEQVLLQAQWTASVNPDGTPNRVGFGTNIPVTLTVGATITNDDNTTANILVKWGLSTIVDNTTTFRERRILIKSFTFTEWERDDGTSLEDDLIQCPDDVGYDLTIYDCENNVVFTRSYPQTPPKIITEEIPGYLPPEYLEVPLNDALGLLVFFQREPLLFPQDYIVRLVLLAPILPPNMIPNFDPLNPEFGVETPLLDIPNPPCSDKFAKIEYICGRCEPCPIGTSCSVQKGNVICCFDSEGKLLSEIEAGCNQADVIC